ncbi:MAG: sterol desaturase family protein [Hahellaceae bacterium]|nr:sterol desaturase family protein [Hahellaceae bacterium]
MTSNENNALIVRQTASPGMRLFESLLFPLILVIGTGLMYRLVQQQQWVQQAYFAIPITVMILVLVLERWHPIEKEWRHNMGDIPADLTSLGLVAFVLEPLMTAIGPAIAISILLALNVPQAFSVFEGMPLWLEALLVILMIDFSKYWFHRFSHERPLLWRVHSVHHAVKRMYLINGFRLHPIYHLCTFVTAILPPMVLGASQEALILHSVVLGIAGSFQHANIKLAHGPLNYIFSTNELHRWHHSAKISEGNNNYGAIFCIWDWMFGSYYKNLQGKPEIVGIYGEQFYPMNNYFKQLLVPFLWKRWMDEPIAAMKAANKPESDRRQSV